jgi:hypothetical protein
MSRLNKTFYVLLIAVASVLGMAGTTSCHDMCIKTMPAVAKGNTLINGAQSALLQAEAAFQAIKDDTARAKAMTAVLEARAALRTAESLLHAASEGCTAANLPGIFNAFALAWEVVRGYLSTFGGDGVAAVHDPIAYTVGLGK